MTNTALTFQSTTFDVVDRNGQPWLTGLQVASALGYADEKSISRIYTRHSDEFTDAMTGVVNLTTPSGEQETRIFSPRGCHALGMFARTKVAKAFRVWVLDVLEGKAAPADRDATFQPGDHLAKARRQFLDAVSQLPEKQFCKLTADADMQTLAQGYLTYALGSRRWILSFDHQGREVITPEPSRQTPEEHIEAWFKPNGHLFETEFLFRLMQCCMARIERKYGYQKSRAEGKPFTANWGIPMAKAIPQQEST
jgi:prophage antirepressor-like protein